MSKEAKKLKCPSCGNELTRIGYTEHGTKVLQEYPSPQEWRNTWEEAEVGGDCAYYCLECNYELDYEELEEAGVV